MLRELLLIVRIVICAAIALLVSATAHAQQRPEFHMGSFVVQIDPSSLSINGAHPQTGFKLPTNRPIQLAGKIFSGKGTTSIKNITFNVTFTNVELKLDAGRLVATTGTVQGKRGNPIRYWIESLDIKIDPSSVRITPNAAKAKLTVRVPVASFSADMVSSLSISSAGSNIASDGSIYGSNFHGAASLSLKSLRYRLRIREEDTQFVQAGSAFNLSNNRPVLLGISLRGKASREGTEAFSFHGTVSPDAKAKFTLNLEEQLTAYPEIDYLLLLKKGWVRLQYGSTGLQGASGSFTADVAVPPVITDNAGQTIVLTDVLLETDKTDSLFQKITLPRKLMAGGPFLIEPAKDATWAYFPRWPLQKGHSSYPGTKDCDELNDFLDNPADGSRLILHNGDMRPGLTVLQGTLYLTSPQITTNRPRPAQVKLPFSGAVTLTPWGLTGPLTGGGSSFVPADQNITEGARSNVKPRASWEQILAAGTARPQEPTERFDLAGLRVLDMRIREMRFCRNKMEEGKATFNYVVHFPFPSFIDLEFEDKSLNGLGVFSQAKGPVATTSLEIPKQYATGVSLNNIPSTLPKGTELLPNPDTHILWAWRLPISFADRGVLIDYGLSPKASVTVAMDTTRQINGAILNSEIWLKSLYSSNSAIRSGVRFSATMDSKSGEFKLREWDRDPFLAKMYANPGSELAVGFAVRLKDLPEKGVEFADPASNPVSRRYDFRWQGSIQFPFFSGNANNTWKVSTFEVKDLVPRLTSLLQMTAESGKNDCAFSTSGICAPETLPSRRLRVQVDQLEYSPTWGNFTSRNLRAFDVKGSDELIDLHATSLNMSSYGSATVKTDEPGPDPEPKDVGGGDVTSPGECGRNRWIRRIIRDWQPSTAVRDLVCYDQLAMCARGTCGICSADYLVGTYEVRTRSCQDLASCPEKTILSVPNVKYYVDLNKIDVTDSEVSVKSDEMDESHATVINIPSAQIAFSSDGRFMEGAFGATLSTVAASLPYEGELRFQLDTQCGWYYFQGAGSFTYGLRFSGQTFIVHAPYKFLSGPSVFIGVSDILDDLRIRALFNSVDEFTDAAGLGDVDPNTVISGVFTGGNVSIGFDVKIIHIGVALGPGNYLYQFNDGTHQSYRIGTFSRVRASAGIGVLGFGVSVTGDSTLKTEVYSPGSLTDLNTLFSRGEFNAKGDLNLIGCANAYLGHCQGSLMFDASLSTSSGFDLGSPNLDGSCGGGGC